MRKNKLNVSKGVGLLAAAAALFVSGSSQAGTAAATPATVQWSDGRMQVTLQGSSTIYYAWTSGTSSPCSNQTLESLKVWQSMAHSAFLSGKKLTITFCAGSNGSNYINTMAISN